MHSKGNHKQDENTTFRIEENICRRSNRQRINLQNTQEAHAAQYKKKKINQKLGRRSKHFSNEDKQIANKLMNINNYQRYENQNYNEVSPYTNQNGHHQKIYK